MGDVNAGHARGYYHAMHWSPHELPKSPKPIHRLHDDNGRVEGEYSNNSLVPCDFPSPREHHPILYRVLCSNNCQEPTSLTDILTLPTANLIVSCEAEKWGGDVDKTQPLPSLPSKEADTSNKKSTLLLFKNKREISLLIKEWRYYYFGNCEARTHDLRISRSAIGS
jgi:hypothetical protein